MKTGVSLEWFKHPTNTEEKKAFETTLRNSVMVLSRLKEIIVERQNSLLKQDISSDSFDNPNWDYKQAFRNGRYRELQDLKDLIKFIDHD